MSTTKDKSQARGPITHELKCNPEPFQAVKDGRKPFEWRKDDRDYRVGDTLWLRCWDPAVAYDRSMNGRSSHEIEMVGYTRDECYRRVTYIIREGFGIPPGYCIMGLDKIDKSGEGDPDAHLSDEDYLKAKQDRFAKGGLANVNPDKYMEEVRGTGKVLTEHELEGVEQRVRTAIARMSKNWDRREEKTAAVKELNEAVNELRFARQLSAPAKAPADDEKCVHCGRLRSLPDDTNH